jgi:proline iminopeptidase
MKIYSEIEPYNTQYIQVDNIHKIYVEQSGNPDGIPIIFLHGGPGAGINQLYRRYFDPKVYNIILYDQRGSGKSTPYGSVENNTTQYLIKDIKTIFEKLGIEKSIIYGGSWGATLALLFSEKHPELVHSLVLRGIFLCRKNDIRWFYQNGAHEIFPDKWNNFICDIPTEEHDNLLKAYHKRIHSADIKTSEKFCMKWAEWEGQCSSLMPSPQIVKQFSQYSVSLAKIETHFFINDCFIDENQIINKIKSIENIKCYMVHGRYDIVCPLKQAYDLNFVYPKSQLSIINDAGHSLLESGTTRKILEIFSKPNELIS